MAAFMTWRIGAEMPPYLPDQESGSRLELPAFVREPFSAAMSQSLLLPAFVALFGIVAALFLVGFMPPLTRKPRAAELADHFPDDGIDDDFDDYVEFVLRREPDVGGRPDAQIESPDEEDCDTDPRPARVQQPRPAPADVWRSHPVDSWRSLLAEPSGDEPIGLAYRRSRIEERRPIRPVAQISPRSSGAAPNDARRAPPPAAERLNSLRRQIAERDTPPRNRHYRSDPDEAGGGGRHRSGD